MSNLLEHAKKELELAGYNIDAPDKEHFESADDYSNACAKNAYKMLEVFANAGHSGFSAQATLQIFNILAKWKPLTELTNNPDEWIDVTNYGGNAEPGTKFQSKRQPSCFSDDGLKTYYDLDAEENRVFEVDDNGERTGYSCFVGTDLAVKHELKAAIL